MNALTRRYQCWMNSGISLLNTFPVDRWFTEISQQSDDHRVNGLFVVASMLQCFVLQLCSVSRSIALVRHRLVPFAEMKILLWTDITSYVHEIVPIRKSEVGSRYNGSHPRYDIGLSFTKLKLMSRF